MRNTDLIASTKTPTWNPSNWLGKSLAETGGLPPRRTELKAPVQAASPPSQSITADASNLLPSLQEILRPQSAGNWLMPYLGSITPQYIEATLRGGLAGNHVQMYQLFDLMWDTSPEIASCIGEWIDGVLAKVPTFEPYHEENEEPSESALEKCKVVSAALRGMRPEPSADENDLRGTLKDILAATFHGQSVLEIDWYDTYGTGDLNLKDFSGIGEQILCPRAAYWVHPMCYGYSRTGRLGLASPLKDLKKMTQQAKVNKLPESFLSTTVDTQYSPAQLNPFPVDKFLIAINKAKTGSPLGGSKLRSLCWWWLASTFCGDYLMKSAELFGIPWRKATYDSTVQEPVKYEIKGMLQAMGSCGWALLPKGVELEFEAAMSQAGSSPQAFLFNLADQQIRKVILHQTMTGSSHQSQGTGAKAFGAVEMDKTAQCIDSGATFAESVINLQLIPSILLRNYGEGGDLEAPTFRLVDNKEGGLIDAQRDQILTQLFDVGEDTMRRKYRMPKPKSDEAICGQDTGTAAAQQKQQMDMQKQSMKTQADVAKHQSDNQVEIAKAQGGSDESDEDLQDDAENKEDKQPNSSVESASAAEPTVPSEEVAQAAFAVHETIEPMVARLQAIEKVTDAATRKKLLQKFLKDHASIKEAMMHDTSLAKVLTASAVKKFVKGLNQ